MRISDWSSDVCSSDLHGGAGSHLKAFLGRDLAETAPEPDHDAFDSAVAHEKIGTEPDDGNGTGGGDLAQEIGEEIGRGAGREQAGQSVSIPGGAVSSKKKHDTQKQDETTQTIN